MKFFEWLKRRWECFKWDHLDDMVWHPVSRRPGEMLEVPHFTCQHCGRQWVGYTRRLVWRAMNPPTSGTGLVLPPPDPELR